VQAEPVSVALVLLGHAYLIILVIVCQALVFKEISALFDVAAKPVHHHHHHSREHSRSGDKAVSPTRAARDARAKAERERWSKVLSW
jgi:phosphatidate cytidylyltransferase